MPFPKLTKALNWIRRKISRVHRGRDSVSEDEEELQESLSPDLVENEDNEEIPFCVSFPPEIICSGSSLPRQNVVVTHLSKGLKWPRDAPRLGLSCVMCNYCECFCDRSCMQCFHCSCTAVFNHPVKRRHRLIFSQSS